MFLLDSVLVFVVKHSKLLPVRDIKMAARKDCHVVQKMSYHLVFAK